MIKQIISCLLAAWPCVSFPQEKVEGFYDSKAKVFHPHENLLQDRTVSYNCDKFKAGYAIVEKRTKGFAGYGLIDTAGRVIIPFKYEGLKTFNQKNYFLFYTKDSIGLVALSSKELLKYRQTSDDPATGQAAQYRHMVEDKKTAIWYRTNTAHDFAVIKLGSKIGLYLPEQERFVLPVECDAEPIINRDYNHKGERGWNNILLTDTYAIYKINGMRIACDLFTGQKSDFYKDIVPLENNLLYVVTKDDKAMLLKDMVGAKNLAGYELLELHENHLLIRAEGKIGLMDINQKVKIPLIYDDIHFMSKRYVWVKKNGAWAIADVEGNLHTGFDFLNIEQLNAGYFTDLLYYTRLDTTGGSIYVNSHKRVYYHDAIDHIKHIARINLKNIGSRISFSALYTYDDHYVITYAQKADGYHLIHGRDKTVEVYQEPWDAIFYLPNVSGGPFYSYKKGNKYGLQPDKVLYETVLYNADPGMCSYRCSWVKKGYIYNDSSCDPQGKPIKSIAYKDFVIR